MSKLGKAAGVFGFILICSALPAAPLERSISPSRQFIIFGGNRILRSAVSDAAERVKSKLLALLQSRDQWSVPILLNLQRPQANAPEVPAVLLNFSQTGAGLKIQLDLLVDRDFQPPVLQREVLRALLLELSYRALPSLPAGTPYVAPPDWLLDGILTLDNESPEVFEGLDSVAASPPVLKIFLAQNPRLLDSQSRALYRACASALVRILLEHENGRLQLNRYIADLPRASVDALSDLFDGKELARKRCQGGQRTAVRTYYVCGYFGAARRMFADENRTGPGEKEFAQSGGGRPRQPAEYRYQGRNRIRTASDPFGRSRASFAAPSGR